MRLGPIDMKLSDVKDLAILAALAAAVYFIYKGWKKSSEPGGLLDTLIAAPIANAYNAMTIPDNVELNVSGMSLVLPNGNRIPMANVNIATDLSFTYNGKRYQIQSRNGSDYMTVAL